MSNSWDNEPDRLEFERYGFKCLILRQPSGFLCGYVGLSEGHPLHGVHYNRIGLEVHGGLTFSEQGDGIRRSGNCWWLGFDCGHSGDLIPRYIHVLPGYATSTFDVYKDINYVTKELESLAAQLKEMV